MQLFFFPTFYCLSLALSFNYLKYEERFFEHLFLPVSLMSDTSIKLLPDAIALVGTRNKWHKETDLNKSVLLLCGWVEDGIPNIYGNR